MASATLSGVNPPARMIGLLRSRGIKDRLKTFVRFPPAPLQRRHPAILLALPYRARKPAQCHRRPSHAALLYKAGENLRTLVFRRRETAADPTVRRRGFVKLTRAGIDEKTDRGHERRQRRNDCAERHQRSARAFGIEHKANRIRSDSTAASASFMQVIPQILLRTADMSTPPPGWCMKVADGK